jgi:hypothetical protein
MKIYQPASIILLLLLVLGIACDQDIGGDRHANKAPEINLSSAPANGDPDVNYRVHLYWNGYDPDGRVDHFEFMVTDDDTTGALIIDEELYGYLENNFPQYTWTSTFAHDSTFMVSADGIPDSLNPDDDLYFYGENDTTDFFYFRKQHTMFIRAVDEFGLVSVVPEYRSFTATTIAPEVAINHPADVGTTGGWDDLPPDIFFVWEGRDSVGDGTIIDPDSTRWILLNQGEAGIDNQSGGSLLGMDLPDGASWSAWLAWNDTLPTNENMTGQRTLIEGLTSSAQPGQGYYMFFVQAKDEAGAITTHYRDGVSLKKMRVVMDKHPRLAIQERSLGNRVTSFNRTYDFMIAEDQPLNFTWRADADDYGSRITGYRYAWDLINEENDDEWSNWSESNRSASRSFSSAEHTLDIEARDYSGMVTRVTFELSVQPFSMENELLFIDDYDNGPSENFTYSWQGNIDNPYGQLYFGNYWHTDDHMRTFWRQILSEYGDYLPGRDFLQVTTIADIPDLARVVTYKRLIWEIKEATQIDSGLARVARFVDIYGNVNQIPYDYLSAFMNKGGQVLLCGAVPIYSMLPQSTEVGDDEYVRRTPMVFTKFLSYSPPASSDESATAVRNFLPYKQFGIDIVTRPADPEPLETFPHAGDDFSTFPTFWGCTGFRWAGEEPDSLASSSPMAPDSLDTMSFADSVYVWFDDAGEWMNGDMGYPGRIEFGLNTVEVYNWNWAGKQFSPEVEFREDKYIPLMYYTPADQATRWGTDPTSQHIFTTTDGLNYDETRYVDLADTLHNHVVAVIGMEHPESPNVLLGFVPYFLEYETANWLIDHILVDIFKMQ